MASVGLQEIPEVVDSTAPGPEGSVFYQPQRVFPVTPQKQWVKQFVPHLRHPIAMVMCDLANQC